MAGVFISGTDTGCGKTTVGCLLARMLSDRGLRVRVLKPIETGCELAADAAGASVDGRIPLDARALAEAAHDDRPLHEICPIALALPAAPAVAADAAGVTIDLEQLDGAFQAASQAGDLTLVEGAGGLRVPITPALDMLGLATRWQLPIVLVARARLGTINHTLLSADAIEASGGRLLGIVINYSEPDLSVADRQNLDWLLEHAPAPILGELSHLGELSRPGSRAPAAQLGGSLTALGARVSELAL